MKLSASEVQESLELVQLPVLGVTLPPELARDPLLAVAIQTNPPAVVPAIVSPTVVEFRDPIQKGLLPLAPLQVVAVCVGSSTILFFLSD